MIYPLISEIPTELDNTQRYGRPLATGWAHTPEKGYSYIPPGGDPFDIQYTSMQPQVVGAPSSYSPYQESPEELERSFAVQVLGKIEENFNRQYDLARRAWDISDGVVSDLPDSPAKAARQAENYSRFQKEKMELEAEHEQQKKTAGEIFKSDASFDEKRQLIESQIFPRLKRGGSIPIPSKEQKQLIEQQGWDTIIQQDLRLKARLNQVLKDRPEEINRYYKALTKVPPLSKEQLEEEKIEAEVRSERERRLGKAPEGAPEATAMGERPTPISRPRDIRPSAKQRVEAPPDIRLNVWWPKLSAKQKQDIWRAFEINPDSMTEVLRRLEGASR